MALAPLRQQHSKCQSYSQIAIYLQLTYFDAILAWFGSAAEGKSMHISSDQETNRCVLLNSASPYGSKVGQATFVPTKFFLFIIHDLHLDVSINGATWNLWKGTLRNWDLYTYQSQSETTNFNADLLPFFGALEITSLTPAVF
jgi:hypothetical protein